MFVIVLIRPQFKMLRCKECEADMHEVCMPGASLCRTCRDVHASCEDQEEEFYDGDDDDDKDDDDDDE